MKYLLIEHGDGIDPAKITICETPESRERLTRETICGDAEAPCPGLDDLRDDGVVHFEGDTSLSWLTVCAIRGEGWEWSDKAERATATDDPAIGGPVALGAVPPIVRISDDAP